MVGLRGSDRSGARTMCPGQIRGGRLKINRPLGKNVCLTGNYSGPRAIISVRGRKYVSHGQLFWPAGDYFGPRAIILARGQKMTKPIQSLRVFCCDANSPNMI